MQTLSNVQSERGDSATQAKTESKEVRTFNMSDRAGFQNDLKAQALNRFEQSALIKELLNLPKDLKMLLALLAYKTPTSENLAKLFKAKTAAITPEMINQLLQGNSKEVINKLIRLIAQSPGNTQNHDQLKQLLGLINQIAPAGKVSPQDSLTQLMLLYLPWLPLADQQKIEVWFEKKKSGSSADEKIAMVIYVSTINLGRFKITIITDKMGNLEIFIENMSEEKIPEERKEVVKEILKTINTGIKEEKIEAKTYLSVVKQKNFQESEERRVTISEVNSILPAVMVSAQKIARTILEADEKISLLEKRASSLP